MGMEISKSFVVKAPADAVWAFLTDPYKVARCLPGAALTEKVDDTTYAGTITVKVGPVTASYRGKMHFSRLDPAAREAEITASGQETKGKGGADMRMKSRLVERGPQETEVTVVSDVNVVGVLAQFGRGMIQDVSDQLFQKFSNAMRGELETPAAAETAAPAPTATATVADDVPSPVPTTLPPTPPTEPILPASEEVLDVGALGAQAAGRAALRTLRRPGFWIGVVVVVVLVYWLSHR